MPVNTNALRARCYCRISRVLVHLCRQVPCTGSSPPGCSHLSSLISHRSSLTSRLSSRLTSHAWAFAHSNSSFGLGESEHTSGGSPNRNRRAHHPQAQGRNTASPGYDAPNRERGWRSTDARHEGVTLRRLSALRGRCNRKGENQQRWRDGAAVFLFLVNLRRLLRIIYFPFE